MPRVLLAIDGDPAGLKRAFGEIRAESRSVASAIAGDFKKAGDEAAKAFALVRKEAGKAITEVIAQEKKRTDETERNSRRRRQISDTEGNQRENVERKVTASTEKEEQKRTSATEKEAKKRTKAEGDFAKEVDRIHQRLARAREREAQQRTRATERASQRGATFGGRAFDTATQAGSQVMGAVRGERSRFATTERSIGAALYQAGGTRADVVGATRQVQDFAINHPGIDSQEVAAALNAAQTEFSVLGNRNTSRADRSTALNQMLSVAALAHNTGNDVGEAMRMEGLFRQSGMDADTRQGLHLEFAGLAQRGAIEQGAVTRQAMPAITGRMALAQARLGPNATREQRIAASREAAAQTMRELEVIRGTQGTSPRLAGNAMLAMNTALGQDVTQQKALTNIRTRYGVNSRAEQALYEADPAHAGQMRLRAGMTDAFNFTRTFGQATGNNPEAFINTFAGGGHGNPLAFQANWRRAAGGLLGQDTDGLTGIQRIQELRDRGSVSLTQADVDRGAEIFQGDTAAREQQRQESRGSTLSDNTSAIVRLTEKLDGLGAEHPLLAPVAGVAGGLLGRMGLERGGAILGRVAPSLFGGAGSAGGGGAAAGIGSGFGAGLAGLMAPIAAGLGVFLHTNSLEGANRDAEALGGRGGSDAEDIRRFSAQSRARQGAQAPSMREEVAAGVVQGIRQSGGVPMRPDPHQNAIGAARNASGSTPPHP